MKGIGYRAVDRIAFTVTLAAIFWWNDAEMNLPLFLTTGIAVSLLWWLVDWLYDHKRTTAQ